MTTFLVSLLVGASLSLAAWCWSRMLVARHQLQRTEEQRACWESAANAWRALALDFLSKLDQQKKRPGGES